MAAEIDGVRERERARDEVKQGKRERGREMKSYGKRERER